MDYKEIFDLSNEFMQSFVQEILGLKNAKFHNELDDILSKTVHNLVNGVQYLYKKIIISFSRGHGKSTHVSVAYPLWRIAKDHNLRILVISSTAAISKSFLSEIVGHIENNDMYKLWSQYVDPTKEGVIPKEKKFKKVKEKWSGESITIKRENLNIKDPTINAVGLFGSILSKRADIIICDDVVNQENSATEGQRQKVIDWIRTTVLPVLVPGGTFVYLGNTWHQDDLVARLMKDPQFDYRKKMPAIIHESNHQELWNEWASMIMDESKSVEDRKIDAEIFYQTNKLLMDEGVQVLWPERFTYKELYLIRLSDGYSFARMYQCDPSNRPDQKFRDEWLEAALKKGQDLILQDAPREGFIMAGTTDGVDLAISLEDSSDDCVILTLDKVKFGNDSIKTGAYIIRNIKRGKFSPNEVKEKIKWDWENVKPDGIRVETVAYQEAIQRDLGDMGIPVRGYHTGGEKNDSTIGVNSLAILAELGMLVLPSKMADARTTHEISKLVNEMRAFPDGHTGDALMALWFAFSEMRDIMSTKYMVPSTMGQVVKPQVDIQNPIIVHTNR